jgi:hypothetical protein
MGWCPNAGIVRTSLSGSQKVPGSTVTTAPDGDGRSMPKMLLKDGAVLVPITSAVCLLLLTAILKNVLLVPAEQLNSDIIIWIIIFMGFIFLYPPVSGIALPGATTRRSIIWSVIIILLTLAIISMYALG